MSSLIGILTYTISYFNVCNHSWAVRSSPSSHTELLIRSFFHNILIMFLWQFWVVYTTLPRLLCVEYSHRATDKPSEHANPTSTSQPIHSTNTTNTPHQTRHSSLITQSQLSSRILSLLPTSIAIDTIIHLPKIISLIKRNKFPIAIATMAGPKCAIVTIIYDH